MSLSPELIVQLIAYLVIVVVFSMKLATKNELKEKVKERNEKIEGMGRSLDRFRDDSDRIYVRKDMCGSWHQQTKDELGKLDQDYKDFRHDIRNSTQKIFDLIDALNTRISELKEIVGKLQMK